MPFTIRRFLASVHDQAERWAAIHDPPSRPRTGHPRWARDETERVVGQRVDRLVTVDEKAQAVTTDLPRRAEDAPRAT